MEKFCIFAEASVGWYDSRIELWRKGAQSLRMHKGFLEKGESFLLDLDIIKKLVNLFDIRG